MKIGKKLILTFILVAVISSLGGIVGFIITNSTVEKYNNALIQYGFSQGDMGLFNTEFNSSRAIIRDIIFSDESETINSFLDDLTKSNAKIDDLFKKMQNEMVNEKEKEYYNSIKENLTKYKEVANQVAALAKQGQKLQAQSLLSAEGEPLSNKIRESTNSLIEESTTSGTKIADSLEFQANVSNGFILIMILVSFLVSIFIAVRISRGISKPVAEMAKAAQKMSKGDLNVQIDVHSKDEIGLLGNAFSETISTLRAYITDITACLSEIASGNLAVITTEDFKGDFVELKNSIDGITVSLNDAISQIDQSSGQVSFGSEQLSGSSQALAQGAAEQASSVEELSATIAEIAAHVKDNAEHATEASLNVNHVRSEIEVSDQYMKDMVAAMTQINESSSQIGKIIKTIEDIAFQTNILALNAAVEAARAGSAGKGFAVVAEEVRNLASKSSEAAKETTALIENSVEQVENGSKIADETAKSLLRVVDSAKVVAETIERISLASNRQSEAIVQVTMGVEQISNVVQTNSATAEESAAASEELSGQALGLKELVQKFQLIGSVHSDSDEEIQTEQLELQPEVPRSMILDGKY